MGDIILSPGITTQHDYSISGMTVPYSPSVARSQDEEFHQKSNVSALTASSPVGI